MSGTAPFPIRLHEILENEDERLASWNNDNRSFRIHDQDRFSAEILPRYFRHDKIASFQRQLNLYGFQKTHVGPMTGTYRHPKFIRNDIASIMSMRRPAPRTAARPSDGGEDSARRGAVFDLNQQSSLQSVAAADGRVPTPTRSERHPPPPRSSSPPPSLSVRRFHTRHPAPSRHQDETRGHEASPAKRRRDEAAVAAGGGSSGSRTHAQHATHAPVPSTTADLRQHVLPAAAAPHHLRNELLHGEPHAVHNPGASAAAGLLARHRHYHHQAHPYHQGRDPWHEHLGHIAYSAHPPPSSIMDLHNGGGGVPRVMLAEQQRLSYLGPPPAQHHEWTVPPPVRLVDQPPRAAAALLPRPRPPWLGMDMHYRYPVFADDMPQPQPNRWSTSDCGGGRLGVGSVPGLVSLLLNLPPGLLDTASYEEPATVLMQRLGSKRALCTVLAVIDEARSATAAARGAAVGYDAQSAALGAAPSPQQSSLPEEASRTSSERGLPQHISRPTPPAAAGARADVDADTAAEMAAEAAADADEDTDADTDEVPPHAQADTAQATVCI